MSRRKTALAHGAGQTARDQRDLTIATVPCPYEPGTHIQATVNRRVDTLAHEYAQKRIDKATFLTGRVLQSIWEAQDGSRVSGASWDGGGRRTGVTDGLSASEVMAIRRIVSARRAADWNDRAAAIVGQAGVRELRAVLCGHGYFADLALAEGRTGERAASEIASRFRWLLRQVTRGLFTVEGDRRDAGEPGLAPMRSWAGG